MNPTTSSSTQDFSSPNRPVGRSPEIRHLIINPAETPLQTNGLAIVARRIAEEQMRAGYAVTLFYLCQTPREEAKDLTDVPTRILPMAGTWMGSYLIRLKSSVVEMLTAEATENTIFHIHHGRDPLLVSLTREFRRRKIPYAMTIHGRYSHVFDHDGRIARFMPALYLSLIECRVLHDARFVQTITPEEQRIVRRIAPRAICELIPNAAYSSGIDGTPPPPMHDAPSPRFPVFGFCGRYAIEHKGLDLLLQGFAEYRRTGGKGTLELVGAGPARGELVAMAETLAVSPYCHVGGPQFGEDKKQVLRTWDYFVLPSRFDVLPTSGLEAALLGVPLIASKPTGLQDFIEDSRSGLVIEGLRPDAVAKAMFAAERVNADEWSQMSGAAFQMAVSMGDWTAIAARLVDLYRRPKAIEAVAC